MRPFESRFTTSARSPGREDPARLAVKAALVALCLLTFGLPGTALLAAVLPVANQSRDEWTLVVIPDTQGYLEPWPEQGFSWFEVRNTFRWLPTVRDQLNIRVVQSVGDMGEFYIGHNVAEWSRVQYLYSYLMNRGIPAIPAAGNHEWEGDENFVWMNNYFDLLEYQQNPWWGGHYEGMQNTYQLFTIGSEDYLFLTLQYEAGSTSSPAVGKQDAVDWAESIVASHPDRKVILTSHWNEDTEHFNQVVAPYPNVIMTLAGHHDRDDYYVTNGRTHNFIQNYQFKGFDQGETGDMQVRFFLFKPMDDQVEWFTYSYVEDYYWDKDSDSQGTFALIQEDSGNGSDDALRYDCSGHNSTSHQTISLGTNTDYDLSVDLRVAPGSVGEPVFDTDDRFDATCQFTPTVTPWLTETCSFNSGSASDVKLRLFATPTFDGEVFWDNVVLTETGSSTNLVTNGDFQSGTTGWSLPNGCFSIAVGGGSTSGAAPTADFVAAVTTGSEPLLVQFDDLSTGDPTAWLWGFGDNGATSTDQNPSFEYTAPGSYSVSLTAMNVSGIDTINRIDHIVVPEPGVLMQLAAGLVCLAALDRRRRSR